MVSPKAVEKYGEDWKRYLIGTGPFMMKEWIPGEHRVHIDITQQQREHRSLDGTPLGRHHFFAIEYPHVQARTNESHQRPICDPHFEPLLKLGVIHAVEEGHHGGREEPPHLAPLHVPPQRAHGVVGAAPGPDAV
jgi:hypothetical protein